MKKKVKKSETTEESVPTEGEILAQLQRLQAEFINFRNRVEKEKIEIAQRARENILLKFLDVKDNFDRAPKLDEGMNLIYKHFLTIFDQEGIKDIQTNEFDPNLHEAIATDPTVGQDQIAAIVQAGYLHNESVIRPAKVVVGAKQGEQKNE
jgi:molecular chaperone GrpE